MKTKRVFQNLMGIIFCICILNKSCVNAQDNCSSEQVFPMLNKFYVEYFTIIATGQFTNNERDQFLSKYCTKNMMDYLQNCKCEYDPFLGAQDADTLSLKTLCIKKDSIINNLYRVSYIDHYSKVKSNIGLIVIKQNECFKIDSFSLVFD